MRLLVMSLLVAIVKASIYKFLCVYSDFLLPPYTVICTLGPTQMIQSVHPLTHTQSRMVVRMHHMV